MKLLLILSSFIAVQAGIIKEDCDGVKIKEICYEKEVLTSGLRGPAFSLAVASDINAVFFSHVNFNDESLYRSVKFDMNTKECEDIKEVRNGFVQTVDPKTQDVFIGGLEGIYKYNPNTNKAELYGAKDRNIMGLFFKDIIYYSRYGSRQSFYTLSNGESTVFKDLEKARVRQFIIDNNDDMIFTNSTGLYSQKQGEKEAVSYKYPIGFSVTGLTVDVNGVAYVTLENGVYAVNKETKSLEQLFYVADCQGLAFDKDNNLFYSEKDTLVKLTPKKG